MIFFIFEPIFVYICGVFIAILLTNFVLHLHIHVLLLLISIGKVTFALERCDAE